MRPTTMGIYFGWDCGGATAAATTVATAAIAAVSARTTIRTCTTVASICCPKVEMVVAVQVATFTPSPRRGGGAVFCAPPCAASEPVEPGTVMRRTAARCNITD